MGWYQEFIGDEGTPAKIYHLCPKTTWENRPKKYEYAPPSFAEEKMVRATHEIGRLIETANCFYQKKSPPTEEWVCLEIDTMGIRMNGIQMTMVPSDMDSNLKCPHVYGEIPEEAIRKVYPVQRDPSSGEFIFVLGLTDVCQSHASTSPAKIHNAHLPHNKCTVSTHMNKMRLLFSLLLSVRICSRVVASRDCPVANDDSCLTSLFDGHDETTVIAQNTGTPQSRHARLCQDVAQDCEGRVARDSRTCIDQFAVMSVDCAKTCQICSTADPSAKTIASHERITMERIFAEKPQVLEGEASFDVFVKMRETEDFMYNNVYVDDEFTTVRHECRLQHELCAYWASIGECEKNKSYMRTKCAPVCQSCRDLLFEYRCPLDRSGPTALAQPGELHQMFERIVTDPQFAPYHPRALSRPNNATIDGDAPWVIVMENFLTADESETLIAQAAARGYKTSGEVGPIGADGKSVTEYSTRRTSSTTWCKEECYEHKVTKDVHDRIEALTGIPRINYEYFQLLKYHKGELYKQHHDYSAYMLERNPGARLLTVYMYLNDVKSGGGTRFPHLNFTVTPKQGRIVIWPSVLNSNTSEIDLRTEHEALPVEEGVKHGANAWIHQRDFKTAHAAGCTK